MEKKKCGFAVTGSEFASRMAKLSNAVVNERGNRHQFTSEEAKAAGRKGGKAQASVPGRMAELGRKGGSSRGPK